MSQLTMALPLPATPSEGRRARDRGLKQTRAANAAWLEQAMAALRRYCADKAEVTVEEFRHWWLANGGTEPTSHFAWGALGNTINRCGWLRYERHQPAKSIKTHSHRIAVYRVVCSG